MKIGILTFHRAINYGAVLQCYALYRTLSDMGHDVEVIDYRPAYIEKYRTFFNKESFRQKRTIYKKIRYLIQRIFSLRKRSKATTVFDAFLEKHLTFSTTIVSPQSLQNSYDVVIFGSDQIWNPRICNGYDQLFWGQFPKEKTKFVSYAASLGNPQNIPKKDWNLINNYLEVFDKISVREAKTGEYIKNQIVSTVLDPTLLASRNIFQEIVVKPKETDYVLLYMLEYDSAAIVFAKKIAENKGLKLIRLTAIQGLFPKNEEYNNISSVSIGEFLGYFKYADYVVNISFHGTAFSIIFNKNFYTLKSNNYERAYGFLKSLKLLDRFVLPTDDVLIKDVDYTKTEIKLEQFRKESREFLSLSINLQ